MQVTDNLAQRTEPIPVRIIICLFISQLTDKMIFSSERVNGSLLG